MMRALGGYLWNRIVRELTIIGSGDGESSFSLLLCMFEIFHSERLKKSESAQVSLLYLWIT